MGRLSLSGGRSQFGRRHNGFRGEKLTGVLASQALGTVGAHAVGWKFHVTTQTISRKNETNLATQLEGDEFTNDAGAVAVAARTGHCRATHLMPIDRQSIMRSLVQPPPAQ